MDKSDYHIKVENLTFRYREDDAAVLDDVSLTVPRGQWLAVTGHNGSGKSTLAKMLNGLLIPDQGVVSIGEWTTGNDSHITMIRKKLGMVFQNPDNQLVAPTVQDDVAFALENSGVEPREMKQRVMAHIKKAGLEGLENAEPHKLSGGQKQRVAIAGAMALQPDVIVLDEATSMLDPEGRSEIHSLLHELRQDGKMTIISITHDLDEAMSADRVAVMNQGRIIADGAPLTIFEQTALLQEAGLDVPFIIQLRHELESQGVVLSKSIRTEKEMVDAICTLKRKT
ncbi:MULTISPECIES: energy-coupling factor transporter ATPase [Alteribacter]|uniref:Energy-coupling factor transporter ATPase n=1 Tax=Alteribacter keqinensis TaxID=2483800 RepID=A0A3M7TMS0_9BACI|nr:MULTISPECIES: energy-coupling factor transporter ATPase [Alteribacter]MBM7096646.1 energy-coupling factor transporter ATPase [Alteribacter salitolerans]RNA66362.1 energy-coupling factor transporter ATPase [Alteribacter keqinensis]